MAKKPLHESHIRSLRFMFSRSLAAPTTAMHLPPVAIPPHYTEQAMPAALFDETHLLDLAPAPHPVLPDAGQYRLKFVHLAKRDTSIILQNENGTHSQQSAPSAMSALSSIFHRCDLWCSLSLLRQTLARGRNILYPIASHRESRVIL